MTRTQYAGVLLLVLLIGVYGLSTYKTPSNEAPSNEPLNLELQQQKFKNGLLLSSLERTRVENAALIDRISSLEAKLGIAPKSSPPKRTARRKVVRLKFVKEPEFTRPKSSSSSRPVDIKRCYFIGSVVNYGHNRVADVKVVGRAYSNTGRVESSGEVKCNKQFLDPGETTTFRIGAWEGLELGHVQRNRIKWFLDGHATN